MLLFLATVVNSRIRVVHNGYVLDIITDAWRRRATTEESRLEHLFHYPITAVDSKDQDALRYERKCKGQDQF
jgi:hypothetical protein